MKWAFFLLFLFLWTTASVPSAQASERVACPKLDRQDLHRRLGEGGSLRFVFFSTWCSDCLHHLRAAAQEPAGKVLAVAVFDSRERVERSLTRLGLALPCAMDDGLAQELGVKVVPAERTVTAEVLKAP